MVATKSSGLNQCCNVDEAANGCANQSFFDVAYQMSSQSNWHTRAGELASTITVECQHARRQCALNQCSGISTIHHGTLYMQSFEAASNLLQIHKSNARCLVSHFYQCTFNQLNHERNLGCTLQVADEQGNGN